MAITAISRDWGIEPSIVRITTTDDLTAITTNGYLTTQIDEIEALQNGAFEWLDGDFVAIDYDGGQGFFVRDATNETFDAAPATPGTLSDTLQDGDIFVGDATNTATGVTPSGDITLTNTGVFGIATGAIVNADVNASAAIAYSKLAALPSANILVGSAGNVATSVAMSGDVTISNTGATTIGASKVLSANLSSLLVRYTAVPITAAEFNGMYAAPKALVLAFGANTMIIVHRIDLLMTFVSAAYANGGVVAAQYDSTANGAGVIATTTLSAATFQAGVSTGFMFNTGVVPQTFSTCVNKGIYLSNITGAFTTGDSTFVAHVYYSVVPTV
jgi:hypothetical protein